MNTKFLDRKFHKFAAPICYLRQRRIEFRSAGKYPALRLVAFAAFVLFSGGVSRADDTAVGGPPVSGIPARPEQLKFPELNYEPPSPRDFRVPLKSGPV